MIKRNRIKKYICLLLILSMTLALSACGEGKAYKNQVYAMDTVFTVMDYGKRGQQGVNSAISTIIALDALVDPELKTSSVYAINHAGGEPVVVTGMIAQMILKAREVYEKSGGSYDITIDPVVELWGFTNNNYYVPKAEEIALSVDRLCMDEMVVDKYLNSGSYTVTLPAYGSITLASCARGCACQYAIDAMRKQGVESGVVSLNGNVQTLGVKPDGSDWTIGISDPNKPESYLGTISVGETSVSTSGGYQRVMSSNPKYHHIFNPKSGYPTTNGVTSVTVICDDGTTADCLSTAMYVLGRSGAIRYWQQNGGFDMIIVTDTNEITCTSGLIERFDLKNSNYKLKFVE